MSKSINQRLEPLGPKVPLQKSDGRRMRFVFVVLEYVALEEKLK